MSKKDLVTLPNVRKMFAPDPGYVVFDADLSGADAQVVAWEAEDEDLKAAFRAGLDVHSKNAEDMLGAEFTKLPKDSDARRKKRQENKKAVHAYNYLGTPRTVAAALGWTVHQAEQFQKRWFGLHPGIRKNFHGKIESALRTNRTVVNAYGYRRVYFDRIDDCFPEAVAWIPQSTVAITTYRGARQLLFSPAFRFAEYAGASEAELDLMVRQTKKFSYVEFLLQVHDSLVFQIPKAHAHKTKEIIEALRAVTPYDDPLTIPWGLASSEVSWGDCAEVKV